MRSRKLALRAVGFLTLTLTLVSLAASGRVVYASPPLVETSSALSITSTSAVLYGFVNPNALDTTWDFISLTGIYCPSPPGGPLIGVDTLTVHCTATGLTPSTTYQYRIRATNADGTTVGATRSFTTLSAPPTVTTLSAASITSTSALLRASINPNGLATTYDFSNPPTTVIYCPSPPGNIPAGMVAVVVSCTATGLTPSTTYQYIVRASNAAGTSFGGTVSFTTLAAGASPTVTTLSAASITSTSALLRASINPNGLATTWDFANPPTTVIYCPSPPGSLPAVSALFDVSCTATGLTPSTTYQYIIRAQNSAGSSVGGAVSFTTLAAAVPDFSITSLPSALSISQGSSGSSTITVTSINGFNSAVTLSTSWLGTAPTGVTVNLPSPITPPSGSSATSILSVMATGSASTGTFTLRVTGTSGSLSHTADVTIQVTATTTTTTAAAPDFTINSSPTSILLAQGGSATATITVGSLNAFNSPVALSYSWVGTAPTGVTISLPGPVTPPSGSSATSTLTVSASGSASTGSFTLSVTGSSGSLSHTVNIGITITAGATPTTTTTTTTPTGPSCLIATTTYGSELAPEVQLLRSFRDNAILKTAAGSSFMTAFNAWYYSFSPQVANYLNGHLVERTLMKIALYPLIGILKVSSLTFAATSAQPEVAVLLSGLVASSLIGSFYLGLPLSLVRVKVRRLNDGRRERLLVRWLAFLMLAGMGAIFVGEVFASQPVLILSSAVVVLSTMLLAATLTSSRVSRRLRTMPK